MPMYDYYCNVNGCEYSWNNFRQMADYKNEVCPKCGMKAKIAITNPNVVQPFKPFWCQDLDVEPIYIESKSQLKREAKKRNLIAAGI